MNEATISNCNEPARHIKAIFQSVLTTIVVSPSVLAAAHAYLDSSDMNVVKREMCKHNDAEQIIKDDRGTDFLTCIVDSHLAHNHSIATIATIAAKATIHTGRTDHSGHS